MFLSLSSLPSRRGRSSAMARGRPRGPTFFFLAQAQKVSCRARIICSKSMASVVEFDFLHHQQQDTTASQDPR